MKVRVKLFSTDPNILAADGSYIPRDVVEQWLASDDYKKMIDNRSMLCGLTHRRRNIAATTNNAALSKVIGRDDLALLTDMPGNAPVAYVTKLELLPNDSWLYANATLFDEKLADSDAAESIKRLKYLFSSGVRVATSAVIIGYWSSESGRGDVLKKIQAIKGFDWTVNPSWKDSQTVEIYDDEGNRLDSVEKAFSDIEIPEGEMRVKAFSLDGIADGIAKSSKINGTFTVLKAKEFSTCSNIINVDEEEKEEEKEYSVTTLRERVRFAKFSPRMRFRRLFIDYKMAIKQMGGTEKMDGETLRVLKSLFTSDVLDIFKTITPEILKGKQINTLIGATSLGQEVRKAAQQLQMPARLAYQEVSKRGVLTPMRYKKLQAAYSDFTKALMEEVFGDNPLPEGLDKEDEGDE